MGENLFEVCYPKSFKNSNKFGTSTLVVMVKRGHEIDLEYSKKKIIDKMNSFFEYSAVEKLKFMSFDNLPEKNIKKENIDNKDATNIKFQKKIAKVKNEKIRNSLFELTKVFKEK